jgi:hypothetical protein
MVTPRRQVTVRKTRLGPEADAADRAFWRNLTPTQRVEMMWDLVQEARHLKGLQGDEPRLQRSVVVLHRRGRAAASPPATTLP